MSTIKDSLTIPINPNIESYSIDWKGAFLDILIQAPIVTSYRKLSKQWGFTLGKTQNILRKFREDNLINIINEENKTLSITINQEIIVIKPEGKKKPRVKAPIKEINIPFSDFWDLYNKKVDTAMCERKWSALKDIDREQIFAHLPNYLAKIPDKKYLKNPSTYLNQKCWLDLAFVAPKKVEQSNITMINNKKYER